MTQTPLALNKIVLKPISQDVRRIYRLLQEVFSTFSITPYGPDNYTNRLSLVEVYEAENRRQRVEIENLKHHYNLVASQLQKVFQQSNNETVRSNAFDNSCAVQFSHRQGFWCIKKQVCRRFNLPSKKRLTPWHGDQVLPSCW